MSVLSNQIREAESLVMLWRQRRNRIARMWKDAQWNEFEEKCNLVIQQALSKSVQHITELDTSLAEALRKLK